MKVFEFSGKMYVKDNEITHQELLNLLYKLYKQHGIRFAGTSKDVSAEFVEQEEYIRVF